MEYLCYVDTSLFLVSFNLYFYGTKNEKCVNNGYTNIISKNYKAIREGVRRLNVAGDMGERGAAGTLPFIPTKGRGELGDVEGALFAMCFSRLAFSPVNLVSVYPKRDE